MTWCTFSTSARGPRRSGSAVRVVAAVQWPGPGKDGDSIEDAVAISADRRGVALCDGASASWDAAGWARTLAAAACGAHPTRGSLVQRSMRLAEAIGTAREHYAPQSVGRTTGGGGGPWYRAAAASAVSHASLAWVEVGFGEIAWASLGDSIVIVAGSRGWLATPDLGTYDFDADPRLVASRGEAADDSSRPEIGHLAGVALWRLGRSPIVVVASDAAAPWLVEVVNDAMPKAQGNERAAAGFVHTALHALGDALAGYGPAASPVGWRARTTTAQPPPLLSPRRADDLSLVVIR